MRAVTLHQPWASLIALGVKTIETRSWATKYRGPLAIHASAKRFGLGSDTAEYIRSLPLDVYRRLPRESADAEMCDNYPLGCVVATCELVDVVPVHSYTCRIPEAPDGRYLLHDVGGLGVRVLGMFDAHGKGITSSSVLGEDLRHQLPYGDFSPGRFAWLLADIKALHEPVPVKGYQGLWEWTP